MFDSFRLFDCRYFLSSPLSLYSLAPLLCISLLGQSIALAGAQDAVVEASDPLRNILIEVYLRDGQPESDAALAALNQFGESRPGLKIVKRNVSNDPEEQARLKKIADFYHFDAEQTPVIYGCGRVIRTGTTVEEFETQIDDLLTLEVFTQTGCPHCDSAHEYLNEFSKSYPGLEIVYRSISADPSARDELNNLSSELQTAVSETPVFHLCNQLMVGFDPAQLAGNHLRQILQKWTIDVVPVTNKADDASARKLGSRPPRPRRLS